MLIIEVSASSLSYDRGEKAELYAAASVQDYWVVNLYDRTVEVRRDPSEANFRSVEVLRAGHSISPLCLPDAVLELEKLFAALG